MYIKIFVLLLLLLTFTQCKLSSSNILTKVHKNGIDMIYISKKAVRRCKNDIIKLIALFHIVLHKVEIEKMAITLSHFGMTRQKT